MTSPSLSWADAWTQAAQLSNEPRPVAELLQLAVEAARSAIPGVDEAGISIARRSGIETVTATSQIVRDVDQRQYELNEGPCLDAIEGQGETKTDDLSTDTRWPKFAPVAASMGFGSQMGVPLYAIPGEAAGLNLYARRRYAFDSSSAFIAQLFAQHAASALGHARTVDQLNRSIESRQVVGQAIGIVMERYTLDEDRAFAFLRRVSSTSNTKLRDVATTLVARANEAAGPVESPSSGRPGRSTTRTPQDAPG